jgi:hypothetical protein
MSFVSKNSDLQLKVSGKFKEDILPLSDAEKKADKYLNDPNNTLSLAYLTAEHDR